jgi:hypothetical protein
MCVRTGPGILPGAVLEKSCAKRSVWVVVPASEAQQTGPQSAGFAEAFNAASSDTKFAVKCAFTVMGNSFG